MSHSPVLWVVHIFPLKSNGTFLSGKAEVKKIDYLPF